MFDTKISIDNTLRYTGIWYYMKQKHVTDVIVKQIVISLHHC